MAYVNILNNTSQFPLASQGHLFTLKCTECIKKQKARKIKQKDRFSKTGVPGRNLVYFNPRNRIKEQFRKAKTIGGWGKGMSVGALWQQGAEIDILLLGSPNSSCLAGRGQPATPIGKSRAARCSKQRAGGSS